MQILTEKEAMEKVPECLKDTISSDGDVDDGM